MSAIRGRIDVEPRDLKVIQHMTMHGKGKETRRVDVSFIVDGLDITIAVKDPVGLVRELEGAHQWATE
jgi:hypothetical protein